MYWPTHSSTIGRIWPKIFGALAEKLMSTPCFKPQKSKNSADMNKNRQRGKRTDQNWLRHFQVTVFSICFQCPLTDHILHWYISNPYIKTLKDCTKPLSKDRTKELNMRGRVWLWAGLSMKISCLLKHGNAKNVWEILVLIAWGFIGPFFHLYLLHLWFYMDAIIEIFLVLFNF